MKIRPSNYVFVQWMSIALLFISTAVFIASIFYSSTWLTITAAWILLFSGRVSDIAKK